MCWPSGTCISSYYFLVNVRYIWNFTFKEVHYFADSVKQSVSHYSYHSDLKSSRQRSHNKIWYLFGPLAESYFRFWFDKISRDSSNRKRKLEKFVPIRVIPGSVLQSASLVRFRNCKASAEWMFWAECLRNGSVSIFPIMSMLGIFCNTFLV